MRNAGFCLMAVLAVVAVSLIVASAKTPMGTAFTYQGRLTDGGGPANGQYDFEFTMYDAAASGNPVGSPVAVEDQEVNNGLFKVTLDFGATVFQGDARWLKIGVRPYESTGDYTYLDPLQELTPTPYALQTRGMFVDTAGNVGIGTTEPQATLHVAGNIKADNVGSVFTRWGNATAPAGTTLIYSGYAYASYYDWGGSNMPIVIQCGPTGPTQSSVGNDVVPLATGEAAIPPGIMANRYVKAAVCLADAPTVQVWGTHTAPDGWEVIYRGYAMGPHYTYNSPTGPICIDSDDFDGSGTPGGSYFSLLYATRLYSIASGSGNTSKSYVPCVVCKKTADP